jgi:hypothetical protein
MNVKDEFTVWFHAKAPMIYKVWYNTTLTKKIDEIETVYYESFGEKLFDIDTDDIPNKINCIKNNITNRYNAENTGFAEYDRKNQNGKPKSILKNFYIKYLAEQYGGIENIEERGGNKLKNQADKNSLRGILIKNIGIIEEGIEIIEKENGFKNKIDILAKDKENNYIVIELNEGRGDENLIGKLLMNKNLIQKNEGEDFKKVRGIIISNEITENLMTACENLTNIELYEYELSIELKRKK